MRVCVVTTSYPRSPGEVAGRFVEDVVAHLREAGDEVEVVSPASFRHYGIAYGDGIVNNLAREAVEGAAAAGSSCSPSSAPPGKSAHGADVVHAHWLPSGIAGLATRKPLVVQLWGSDLELARRLPWIFRPIMRRARLAVCASDALAAGARALGACDVRVIPGGDRPARTGGRAGGTAAPPLRRSAVGGKGCRRPRGGDRRPRARRRRRRPASVGPAAGAGLRAPRRARALVRARGRRGRAVAAGRLRGRRP